MDLGRELHHGTEQPGDERQHRAAQRPAPAQSDTRNLCPELNFFLQIGHPRWEATARVDCHFVVRMMAGKGPGSSL